MKGNLEEVVAINIMRDKFLIMNRSIKRKIHIIIKAS